MIDILIQNVGEIWFSIAYHDNQLVATAAGSSRERAKENLEKGIPSSVPYRLPEDVSGFAADTIRMLAELEAGDETNKNFILSEEYLSDNLRRILYAAAAVPLGYVTTYGNIAVVADTNARVIGRTMATNPLYPIVPCHRVVGADLALVGYGGKQDDSALRSKLNRLRAEALGYEEREIAVMGRMLPLYPVEWVIRKANQQLSAPDRQLTFLFD